MRKHHDSNAISMFNKIETLNRSEFEIFVYIFAKLINLTSCSVKICTSNLKTLVSFVLVHSLLQASSEPELALSSLPYTLHTAINVELKPCLRERQGPQWMTCRENVHPHIRCFPLDNLICSQSRTVLMNREMFIFHAFFL